MKTRFATAVSGCAVLALTLTGCGDDNGEETDAWAKNVCDQVQPQVERIEAANTAIAEASEGDGEPDEVQEVYSASYAELSGAFESLAGAVNDAGDPPVDDGEELRTEAVAELNGLAAAYADLQTASDELDTSDRAAFASGLREMVGQLENLGESGDEALGKLQSGELGEAMARQDGCQSPAPTATDDGEDAGDGDSAEAAETEAEAETETEAEADAGTDTDADANADAASEAGDDDTDATAAAEDTSSDDTAETDDSED